MSVLTVFSLGSRDGTVVRVLASHQMWPGFDSRTRRHMWVEFVVGSLLAPRGFSAGTPVFSSPQKPAFPNSNSIWDARTRVLQSSYHFTFFFTL